MHWPVPVSGAADAERSVAAYQLVNRVKAPGALVFDESLPSLKGAFLLSTVKHPEVLKAFNAFLAENSEKIEKLKATHQME